ncbi:MAG: hypothetical protein AAB532_00245 [Patescibacteria group bacterium]
MERPKYLTTKPQRAKGLELYAFHVQSVIDKERIHFTRPQAHFTREEKHGWEVQDSPLLPRRLDRFILGEEYSYHATFRSVLPEGTNLKTDIVGVLGDRKGEAIGIDLGGLGSRLFADFPKGFFAKTQGVVLFDSRSMLQCTDDTVSNHGVIVGDITTDKTRESVDRWLGGKKVDLIIERMMGGLDEIPHDLHFLQKQFSVLYDMLSEGGIMFIQVPKFATKLASLWVDAAREESLGTIDVKQGIYHSNQYGSTVALRIRKLPGAPRELPLISQREVRGLYKAA